MISLELIMATAQIRAEIDLTMSHGVSLSALVRLWARTRLAQGTCPSAQGCKAVTGQVALAGGWSGPPPEPGALGLQQEGVLICGLGPQEG